MSATAEQDALIAEAEGWVRRFVTTRGRFSMFSLAKHKDGKWNPIQPTDEFRDQRSALVETIKVLRALAQDGQIVGNVLCTPMNDGAHNIAVLDVEHKTDGRIIVLLPFKKRFFGGWSFGEKQYKHDVPKLFAS